MLRSALSQDSIGHAKLPSWTGISMNVTEPPPGSMAASFIAASVGPRPLYTIVNNSTLVDAGLPHSYGSNNVAYHSSAEALLAELRLDECIFLSVSLFFLYCYIGLIRLRVRQEASFVSLVGDLESGLVGNRGSDGRNQKKRCTGVSQEQIERCLKAYIVEFKNSAGSASSPSTSTSPNTNIAYDQSGCAICLEDYRADESTVRLLKCSHIFHAGCIDEWLRRCNKCPCCLDTVLVVE